MSRDLEDDNYYTSSGGLIPIKWTAIEVSRAMQGIIMNTLMYNRHFISRSTPWEPPAWWTDGGCR